MNNKLGIMLALLLPSVALAHEECPICSCTAIETTAEWRNLGHDPWWSCLKGQIRPQQAQYQSCVDRVNLLSVLLKRAGVSANPAIIEYNPGNHPIEDRVNDLEFALVSVEACQLTSYQFGLELGACEQYYGQLLALVKKKLKLMRSPAVTIPLMIVSCFPMPKIMRIDA